MSTSKQTAAPKPTGTILIENREEDLKDLGTVGDIRVILGSAGGERSPNPHRGPDGAVRPARVEIPAAEFIAAVEDEGSSFGTTLKGLVASRRIAVSEIGTRLGGLF